MPDYKVIYKNDPNYLEHHGILGQRWGQMHGPPYPLDSRYSTGKSLRERYKLKRQVDREDRYQAKIAKRKAKLQKKAEIGKLNRRERELLNKESESRTERLQKQAAEKAAEYSSKNIKKQLKAEQERYALETKLMKKDAEIREKDAEARQVQAAAQLSQSLLMPVGKAMDIGNTMVSKGADIYMRVQDKNLRKMAQEHDKLIRAMDQKYRRENENAAYQRDIAKTNLQYKQEVAKKAIDQQNALNKAAVDSAYAIKLENAKHKNTMEKTNADNKTKRDIEAAKLWNTRAGKTHNLKSQISKQEYELAKLKETNRHNEVTQKETNQDKQLDRIFNNKADERAAYVRVQEVMADAYKSQNTNQNSESGKRFYEEIETTKTRRFI